MPSVQLGGGGGGGGGLQHPRKKHIANIEGPVSSQKQSMIEISQSMRMMHCKHSTRCGCATK
jgi:hypothetical protein